MNRLLSEKKLTFDKAMELAQAIESAERDTRQLQAAQSTSTTPQVHLTTAHKQKNRQRRESSRPARQGNSVACYRCGGPLLASTCRFINTVCHACKKRGHIVRVCRSKAQPGRPVRKANYIVETELVTLRTLTTLTTVVKQSGEVRIYGDYKITVNRACTADSYPLPRVDELLANLAGGQYFSKLDLSQAYLQLPLDEVPKEYVTVNTHKGLYKYNRLPFGVSSAPSIFQRTMENLLQGIRGVSVYIDDILVTGSILHDHLEVLTTVLEKLQNSGLKLNRSKCFFLRSQIEYLGHVIDKEGLHPSAEKVRAIQEARKPQNVSELRSFFGIINYYNRFLPNLSTILAPLYSLLQKDVK